MQYFKIITNIAALPNLESGHFETDVQFSLNEIRQHYISLQTVLRRGGDGLNLFFPNYFLI